MSSAAVHEGAVPVVAAAAEPEVVGIGEAGSEGLSRSAAIATPLRVPRLQPADVLALQRSAGNRAVLALLTAAPASAIQRVPTRLTAQGLAAIVNVDPALLDEGSRLLQTLGGTRPQAINDSKASSLSNCALVTMAAIEGGKTSGQFANELRTGQNLPPSDVDPTKAEQSQQAWAINVEDAQLM